MEELKTFLFIGCFILVKVKKGRKKYEKKNRKQAEFINQNNSPIIIIIITFYLKTKVANCKKIFFNLEQIFKEKLISRKASYLSILCIVSILSRIFIISLCFSKFNFEKFNEQWKKFPKKFVV